MPAIGLGVFQTRPMSRPPRSRSRSRPSPPASPTTSTSFDFELSREQLAAIDALDTGVRGGPDPDSITLENYGMEIPEA
jgi:hypothetical protein